MTIKMKFLQGINWVFYIQFCKREGLSPSYLSSLDRYIKKGGFKHDNL